MNRARAGGGCLCARLNGSESCICVCSRVLRPQRLATFPFKLVNDLLSSGELDEDRFYFIFSTTWISDVVFLSSDFFWVFSPDNFHLHQASLFVCSVGGWLGFFVFAFGFENPGTETRTMPAHSGTCVSLPLPFVVAFIQDNSTKTADA